MKTIVPDLLGMTLKRREECILLFQAGLSARQRQRARPSQDKCRRQEKA